MQVQSTFDIGQPADVQVRKENWEHMSTSLRAWFAGPPPSAPRTDNEEDFDKEPPQKSDPPAPAFGLVRMDVEEVDYVNLERNVRQLYVRNGKGWTEQALNP